MAEAAERSEPGVKRATKLIASALSNALIYAVPLFLAVWTLHWWRAWVVVGIAFLGTIGSLLSLSRANTRLLEERMKPPVQKGQPIAGKIMLMFLFCTYFGLLIFIPVDAFRLHLVAKPGTAVSALGLTLFLLGWWVAHKSLRENRFAAPVVKHQDQRKLPGYQAYTQKVRFRLIPYLW